MKKEVKWKTFSVRVSVMIDAFVPVAAPNRKEAESYLKHYDDWKEDKSFPDNCYGHVVREMIEIKHPYHSHWKSDISCWFDSKKYPLEDISVARSFVTQYLKYPSNDSPEEAYDTYFDEEAKLYKQFDSQVKDALP